MTPKLEAARHSKTPQHQTPCSMQNHRKSNSPTPCFETEIRHSGIALQTVGKVTGAIHLFTQHEFLDWEPGKGCHAESHSGL